ncbi:MAG TPA: M48 family metallopeptidase [Candidatus Hydrogenedentes bacterium]|nr:M48 family metallopeptidase [Candidatus Hydrogenedentota bacterium]
MFELIQANQRRSRWLLAGMFLVLLGVGFTIGALMLPTPEQALAGGIIGMGVAFMIWALQALIAWSSGDRLLMAVAGARQIQKADHPQLFNVVEEMTLAARLPAVPQVYIIEDMSLNAFATGRKPEKAAVAVTAGLLSKLNRDQLQGVIAHEIAHIANRDTEFMTFAGIMLGSIILITELFHRSIWYATRTTGSMRRYSSNRSGKDGNAALLVLLVISMVLAVLAPLLAQILYFACSRRREYLADAGGAVFTRYPEGLASALEVIAGNPGDKETTSRAMAPMYIINPLQSARSFNSLFSTHPPVDERIRILRNMSGGTAYRDYAAAWGKVSGSKAVDMPASAMAFTAAQSAVPAAQDSAAAAASSVPADQDARQRHRETAEMLRRMHHYRLITCSCGLKAKIPPQYPHAAVKCPRCGKMHRIA